MPSRPSELGGLCGFIRRIGHRLAEAFKSLSPQPPPPSANKASQTLPPGILVAGAPGPAQIVIGSPLVNTLPTTLQATRDIGSVAWAGLDAALRFLQESSGVFPPLKSAIGGLIECLDVLKAAAKRRKEYIELAVELTTVANDLGKHLRESRSVQMSGCLLNLVNGLEKQTKHINARRQRWGLRHYAEASQDIEELAGCYRRIETLFRQLQNNAILSIWSIADEQLTNTRLESMLPAKQARYDSGISAKVRRHVCTPNTRSSILAELQSWASDPDSPKVYWMNGMAGTGKTTIAYSICAELEKTHQLAASFFCSRALPDCREVTRIVPTIAYQLAHFSLPFQGALCRVLSEDPDTSTRGAWTQFRKLVSEPLLEVKDDLPAGLVIVVDALDECSGREGAQTILDLLFHFAAELPIKFFITCRPEPGILEMMHSQSSFSHSVLHLHDIERSVVQADIETYLSDELARLSVSEEEVKRLAKQAGKLFIYAATAVRYIQPRGLGVNPRKRLTSMIAIAPGPPSRAHDEIDALYATILVAALEDRRLEPLEKTIIQSILHTAICAREPMSIETLANLLRLDNQEEVVSALQPLRSVLHVSEGPGLVSPLHASFSDYLLSYERSGRFFCDKVEHNALLAQRCFDAMDDLLRFNLCELESSFVFDADVPDLPSRINEVIPPHLFYACQYWGDHLELSENSNELGTSLDKFLSHQLLFWMEVLNLKQCISKGTPILCKAHIWLQGSSVSAGVCKLAYDAWKILAVFCANPVSRSTPHIYISLLPFWFKEAPVLKQYEKHLRGRMGLHGSAIDQRRPGALAVWTTTKPIISVASSPNGTYVASGSSNHTICIWNAETGTALAEFKGHTDRVSSVAFSPSGSCLVSGSHDHTLRIWDIQTGDVVAGPFEGHTSFVSSVAFSPDGARVASGSHDHTIRVWDVQSGGVVVGPLKEHGDAISSVAFSPNGAYIVSGSHDYTIRTWDARDGSALAEFKGHTDRVSSVTFSPDSARIASGSHDHTIRVWDVQSRKVVADPFKGHTHFVSSVVFSADGGRVASCSWDRTIRVWDAQSGYIVAGPFKGHDDWVWSVALLPGNGRLVSSSDDSTIRIWDMQSENAVVQASEEGAYWIRSVAFSPDGARIASGSDDSTIRIWDKSNGNAMLQPFAGHTSWVRSVMFSPDGARIASGSHDCTIRVWDVQNGDVVAGPFKGHADSVSSIAFSPDGALLVSGSCDHTIRVWDSQSGDVVTRPPKRHTDAVSSVAFSPDGARVASGSHDHTICIWDVKSGDVVVGPFKGHTEAVSSVAFSPNGTYIASGSHDHTLRIWSAQDGSALAEFKGHTDRVSSVAFSLNGACVVSGSRDRTILVWDIQGKVVAGPFEGHTSGVMSVAFAPDGTSVVSCSSDCAIRIWDVPSADLAVKSNLLDDWSVTNDGWVVGQDSRLLLWVPPDVRAGLERPQNTAVIYSRGSLELDFDGAMLGARWQECYSR